MPVMMDLGGASSGSAAEQLQLLVAITRALRAATDVRSALVITLEHFGMSARWAFGAGWIPDASDGNLHCTADWTAPGRALADFAAATRETVFAAGIGLPGRVWASGQWAWILDVTLDTNFPRLRLAAQAGLRTGVAMPILADDRLVAVIEFFFTEPQLADAPMIELVAAVASQLGSVVEQIQLQQVQRAELAELQRLQQSVARELSGRVGAIRGACEDLAARLRDLDAVRGDADIGQLLGRLDRESSECARLVEDVAARVLTPPPPGAGAS
jgi:GAF domain-containing protein